MLNYTIEKILNFDNDEEYKKIINKLSHRIQNGTFKTFVPNMSVIHDIDNETRVILDQLYKIIILFFEEKVYKQQIKIIDEKILTHLNTPNQKIDGAFAWHVDNHPENILNIMIYLTDVGENDGAFQYASFKDKDQVIKFNFSNPKGGILKEHFINDNKEKIKINQVEGLKGTIFAFSNCILHRASFPVDNKRTALILQVSNRE